MANIKISELPAATLPLAGSELVPIVQSGTTDQVTVANLTAGRTLNVAAITATGTVSGATVTASGTVSGATVSGTTVSGTTFTASGTVSGATVSGTTVVAGAGTVAAPSISPTGDSNTGVFFPAADTIAFSEGGAEVLRLNSSGQTEHTLGTALLPSLTAAGDTNTGVYFPGADRVGVATNGTQRAEFDASGNFLFNSGYGSVARAFGCRAWVNFDGTTNVGGFCTIRASGNVSSISDNGTGDYTVNFATVMPDANYAVVAMAGAYNSVSSTAFYESSSTARTASLVRLSLLQVGAGFVDGSQQSVAIFR